MGAASGMTEGPAPSGREPVPAGAQNAENADKNKVFCFLENWYLTVGTTPP
jgi:hypothetical protein